MAARDRNGFSTLESEGQTAALPSPDDALEPVNERDCDVVAHSPGTTCSPPTPPFPPLQTPPSPPSLLLFCLKFNKGWKSGGLKRASGVFWHGFMSHAGAM